MDPGRIENGSEESTSMRDSEEKCETTTELCLSESVKGSTPSSAVVNEEV